MSQKNSFNLQDQAVPHKSPLITIITTITIRVMSQMEIVLINPVIEALLKMTIETNIINRILLMEALQVIIHNHITHQEEAHMEFNQVYPLIHTLTHLTTRFQVTT